MRRSLRPLLLLLGLLQPGWAERLTIYTEIDAPLAMLAPNGQLTGLAVDVVQEIQRRVRNTDPIAVVPWARGYLELQTLPNVALFSTARTPERNGLFKWVGPIDERQYVLYIRADSEIVLHSLEDAKKLEAIGVYKNDARDLYLTHMGFTNLDRTIDNIANVKKLMAGRIDAFAYASVGIDELAKSAGFAASDFKEALPLLKVQLFIAMSMKTPDATVEAWNKALEAMKKDETFEHLFQKYYPDRRLPQFLPPKP